MAQLRKNANQKAGGDERDCGELVAETADWRLR
jgi:hypothetical protein